jgi:thiamine biosynthesis lipoprotein
MKSRSSVEIRRCRPLLGTLVEITASGAHTADLECGIKAGFLAVAKVQQLMSFHDPESELSHVNRHAFCKAVRVHAWTWQVLQSAQAFSRNSGGIFDITTARHLLKWKYLPRLDSTIGEGSWRDIIFEKQRRIRFCRPLCIDLGGIAKGFAVDRAVDALKQHGVTAGIVNAGGDLRAFGSRYRLVHVRDPAQPLCAAGAMRIRERAIATSGVYFALKKHGGHFVSPMLDGRTGRAARELISVTVGAADCITADALTKVVFVLREQAAPLLSMYCADAFLLERAGASAWKFHASCDTSLQS